MSVTPDTCPQCVPTPEPPSHIHCTPECIYASAGGDVCENTNVQLSRTRHETVCSQPEFTVWQRISGRISIVGPVQIGRIQTCSGEGQLFIQRKCQTGEVNFCRKSSNHQKHQCSIRSPRVCIMRQVGVVGRPLNPGLSHGKPLSTTTFSPDKRK